jgi:hypothetical protein
MDDLIRSTADSKFVLKICIPTSYFQELIESRCSTYIRQKYMQNKKTRSSQPEHYTSTSQDGLYIGIRLCVLFSKMCPQESLTYLGQFNW